MSVVNEDFSDGLLDDVDEVDENEIPDRIEYSKAERKRIKDKLESITSTRASANKKVKDLHEVIEWCEFNAVSIEAVKKLVKHKIPVFMEKAGIKNVEGLSIVNPSLNMKVLEFPMLSKKTISWGRFLNDIARICFSDFSFEKFDINREVFFGLIIREIIVPLALKTDLDFDQIEEDFNEILLKRLVARHNYLSNQ